MSISNPASAPLMERQEVHKSAKTLENIVSLFYDYCQTLSAMSSTQKKLGKALKDASQVKGTHNTPANALSASSAIFEALAEVDSKFVRICEREYEATSSELKKWFKKLNKEEKTHDDLNFTINNRIKAATQGYDKKSRKKERDLDVDLISSLGNDLAQAKIAHSTFVSERHTAVLFTVGGCVARLADAEWVRCCEEVRKIGPAVGKAGEWKAYCEGGWMGATSGDLEDLSKQSEAPAPTNTQISPIPEDEQWIDQSHTSRTTSSPEVTLLNLHRGEGRGGVSSISSGAGSGGLSDRNSLVAPSFPRVTSRSDSLQISPSPVDDSGGSHLLPPFPVAPSRGSSTNSLPSPSSPTVKFAPTPSKTDAGSSIADSGALSNTSSDIPFPSVPTRSEPSTTPAEDRPSNPPSMPQPPTSDHVPENGNANTRDFVPPIFTRDSELSSSPPLLNPPTSPNPFRPGGEAGVTNTTTTKEPSDPNTPRTTAIDRPAPSQAPPEHNDITASFRSRNVAFEDDKKSTGGPTRLGHGRPLPTPGVVERSRPMGRSSSIDSTFSNGSHVAAMRDRYAYGERQSNNTSSLTSRDPPRLQQSVSNLATRYATGEAPVRPAAPPSSFSDRFNSGYGEKSNSRYSYESDREGERDRDYFNSRGPPDRYREREPEVLSPRASQEWPNGRDSRDLGRRDEDATKRDRDREGYRDRDSERERDRERSLILRERERLLDQRQRELERERERILITREKDFSNERDRMPRERMDSFRDGSLSNSQTSRQPYSPPPSSLPPTPAPSGFPSSHLSPPSSSRTFSGNNPTKYISSTSSHASSCGCHECSAKHYATPSPSLSSAHLERFSTSADRLASPSLAPLNSPALRPLPKSPQINPTTERDKKGSSVGWMGKGLRRLSMPIGAAFASDKDHHSSAASNASQRSLVGGMPAVDEDGRGRGQGFEGRNTLPVAVMRR